MVHGRPCRYFLPRSWRYRHEYEKHQLVEWFDTAHYRWRLRAESSASPGGFHYGRVLVLDSSSPEFLSPSFNVFLSMSSEGLAGGVRALPLQHDDPEVFHTDLSWNFTEFNFCFCKAASGGGAPRFCLAQLAA